VPDDGFCRSVMPQALPLPIKILPDVFHDEVLPLSLPIHEENHVSPERLVIHKIMDKVHTCWSEEKVWRKSWYRRRSKSIFKMSELAGKDEEDDDPYNYHILKVLIFSFEIGTDPDTVDSLAIWVLYKEYIDMLLFKWLPIQKSVIQELNYLINTYERAIDSADTEAGKDIVENQKDIEAMRENCPIMKALRRELTRKIDAGERSLKYLQAGLNCKDDVKEEIRKVNLGGLSENNGRTYSHVFKVNE